MSKRGRRAALLVVLVLATATVSGCGVPADGSSHTIGVDDVPTALARPDSAVPSPSPSLAGPVTVPRVFFLNGNDELVATPLPVLATGTESVERAILRALAAGPTDRQRALGLGSALGPDVSLGWVDVVDGTARVEVGSAPRSPAADRLPLAVGQVVLSVTSVAGVDRVMLLQDGQPVEAPLPDGAKTAAALSPSDYTALVAPVPGRPKKAEPGPSGG